ncbi:Short-chain dehydrogenase/reductase SDR [Hoyosella subflava DQS3-9A1]|uniref:Short-chain dehydrogenase/reductase SDR n=2 Tax=Hoyosella TaxID=697025 RepID=F6EF45_HOYSD|nr:Short-chain dehydrogenase/reductase SDR [Hoyosella subflava DQS3-9A1]
MGDMDGKVGLVFGGANGIGRAGAIALARRGADIVIADRDRKSGEELVSNLSQKYGNAAFVDVDVLDDDSVAAAYASTEERFKAVHAVVNSAGTIAHNVPDVFERNINMLLLSVYRSMRCAVDSLGRAGGGSVVNIASIAGITGSIGAPGYGPAKHGVVGMTKDYALSTAKDNIRVNVVCPGYVLTQQVSRLAPDQESSDRLINEQLRVPMRRWGKPEEIGSVIGFLSSPESSFMTGSVIVVDGGLTAR